MQKGSAILLLHNDPSIRLNFILLDIRRSHLLHDIHDSELAWSRLGAPRGLSPGQKILFFYCLREKNMSSIVSVKPVLL